MRWEKALSSLLTAHLCKTHKSTTETHFREVFVSRLHLAYGLGNLELSLENRLVFIKLANAFSLGHGEERVLCRNTQGILSTLKLTRIYYSTIMYYGLEDTTTFFCFLLILFFISTLNILFGTLSPPDFRVYPV